MPHLLENRLALEANGQFLAQDPIAVGISADPSASLEAKDGP